MLIVEDGTGLATANTYVSLADVELYFEDRGITAWTGTDALKEAALIRATFALDGLYGTKWYGDRSSSTQALDWPRTNAWDKDGYGLTGVPYKVVYACCEAALLELTTPGALTLAQSRGGMIKSESVGPVAVSYFNNAPSGTVYASIKNHLERVVRGSSRLLFVRG